MRAMVEDMLDGVRAAFARRAWSAARSGYEATTHVPDIGRRSKCEN
jgi:hypothetical protein